MKAQTIIWEGQKLVFGTPNQETSWRVNTFETKEPDTLEWLKTLEPDDILYDVGANVGMYSIPASNRCRVYAFEPEASNFSQLMWNIRANRSEATAFPVAVGDRARLDILYMSSPTLGGSCHTFGDKLNYRLQEFNYQAIQGVYGTTLDQVTLTHPTPSHIKIDVDGIEHLVIAGAQHTLRQREVRTVLVELNTDADEHRGVIDTLTALGFDLKSANPRKDGAFEGIGNHIFWRD